jgi:hypothetical protein
MNLPIQSQPVQRSNTGQPAVSRGGAEAEAQGFGSGYGVEASQYGVEASFDWGKLANWGVSQIPNIMNMF